jgi:nucleoid-associated protein YgaU
VAGLAVKTFLDGVQLPVNPFEDITIAVSADNKSVDIISLGEVTVIGPRKLAGFTIKSLLTDTKYPFSADGDTISALAWINRIYAILDSQEPVRFIITGIGAEINMLCSIEKFQHAEKHGQIGEYYYELQLKEYRTYGVRKVSISGSTTKKVTTTAARTGSPSTVSNYSVRSGDSLSAIAKAQLGDSSRWREIYNLNKDVISNPNKIYPGQSLVMPS